MENIAIKLYIDSSQFVKGASAMQNIGMATKTTNIAMQQFKAYFGAQSVFALASSGMRGIVTAVSNATKAYKEQEKVEAKLASVIKGTGGAAGFTTTQMIKQAQALQQVTTYGDEAIIGMQSVLATFDEISGDTFNDATEAVLDLSTVLGTDLKSSAIQLGKVLQDPVKNLSVLSRSGVSIRERLARYDIFVYYSYIGRGHFFDFEDEHSYRVNECGEFRK